MPLEVAAEWIEHLNQQMGPGHPLHGKKVFPSCRKEDVDEAIIQFDIDDDGTYAIVYFHRIVLFKGRKMPEVEIINTREELKQRFHDDHMEALDS